MRVLKSLDGSDGRGRYASVLCFGDIAPVGKYGENIISRGEGTFAPLLATIQASDLVFGNLECPLTSSKDRISKTGPALYGHPDTTSALAKLGFNVLSTANNHILDCGVNGLSETLSLCEKEGIATVGAGMDIQEATKPIFIEAGGIRFGFLAFADKEFSIASETSGGAAPLDAIISTRAIQAAKTKCDFLIVSIHGGLEHFQLPTAGLRDISRFFVECGAQAVMCHHAHVPGSYEIYRNAPIFYSLGNTYMPARSGRPLWNISEYVRLKVSVSNGEVHLGVGLGLIETDHAAMKLRHLEPSAAERIELGLSNVNSALEDDARFRRALDKHYAFQRRSVLTAFAPSFMKPLRRMDIGRRFLERMIWSEPHKKLNLLRCEAHREVLLRLVELEASGQKAVRSSVFRQYKKARRRGN